MNIQKATTAAMAINGLITRAPWRGHLHIKPTDWPECCFAHTKGETPCPRWEPKAEDLMADDWEVTTEEFTGHRDGKDVNKT